MKSNLKKQVVQNAFFQGISGIIGALGGLVFTITAGRILLPELFGIYSLALTIILTIITLSDLGIGTAIIRYISESLNKKNKEQSRQEARSRFLFLFKFKFFSSLILALLLFLLSGIIAALFKKPDLVVPLQIGSVYLLLSSIYGIIGPLFIAVQKTKYSAISEAIFEISRVGLLFAFLFFYKSVWVVFLALSIALFLASLFSFIVISKKYRFFIEGENRPVDSKRMLLFSGFLAMNSINAVIFTNVDKLAIGYFLPQAEFIGFYVAILTIVNGVLGLVSFSNVVFPEFVNFKKEKLKNFFQTTFNYMFMMAFPATIGLSYLFLPILRILYGSEYVPANYHMVMAIVSILLSFLVLSEVLTTIYTILFNAKERPKWPALLVFISSLLNLILNVVFILLLIKIRPEYALIGASAATLISRYFNLVFLSGIAKKKFNLSPNLTIASKSILASLVMLVFLFVFGYFIKITIPTLIVSIILSVGIYVLMMVLLKGIKKKDIQILKSIQK